MAVVRLTCMLLISIGVVCGQPLDVMLVLETSPGTEQAIGLIRPSVLHKEDRAGVVAFVWTPQLLQPVTEDREEIATALQQAGLRIGVAVGESDRRRFYSNFTVDLAAALTMASNALGREDKVERKRAIVVFFASEDPSLGAHLDSLKTLLNTVGARLYGVVVQRTDPAKALAIPQSGTSPLPAPTPVITTQFISQLAKESGGRIFRSTWDLKKILAQARKP